MSERIDNLVDTAKVDAQFAHLGKQIDAIIKKIQTLNSLAGKFNIGGSGGSGGGAGGSGGGRGTAGQAKSELEQLQAAIERLKNSSTSAAQLIAQYNDQIARNARENRNAAAVNNTHADSLNGMRARLNQLLLQYDNLTRAQRRNRNEGQAMLDQIKKLQAEIRQLEFATGRFGRNVGNYPQLVGGIKGFLGAFGVGTGIYAVKQILDEKNIISDRLGDLQRLMGLTAKEADNLYESFKRLGTRTDLDHLMEVAAVAARAGIGKDAIVGITEAIDKLVVVLGKDLGDADQITASLVKIVNIFSKDGKVTGQALTEIGNGLLTLSHSGVSTAPFIVDYTQRLAGLAKTANVSLKSALGLGAGFEELGQSAEVAGTATVQLITKIAANVPKFSKIAGKSVEEFTKILRNDPVEALLQVSRGLTRGAKGFDEIAESFKESEARGIRVIGVLGALGSKTDFFRSKIEIAGRALGNTNNIQEQFEIKNNTLKASFEKLGKAAENAVNNPNSGLGLFFKFVIDGLTGAITLADKFTDVLINRIGRSFSAISTNPKDLSSLAREGRVYTGKIGPVGLYNSAKPGDFKAAYDQAIQDAKESNNSYLKEFERFTEKEQSIYFKGIRASFNEFKARRDELAKISKNSPEFFEADIAMQKEYDRLIRASKIILDQRRKPIANDGERPTKAPSEKELNAAAKLKERELKADEDAEKFNLQTQIEAQEEILNNEKASLAERLAANEKYYDLKNQLASKDAEYEKKRIDVEIGRNRASAKEKETVDAKLNYNISKNTQELGKNIVKILGDSADERTRILLASYQLEKGLLDEQQNEELATAQATFKEKIAKIKKNSEEEKKVREQYEDDQLRIANKYDILELQAELEVQEQILELMKQRELPVEEQEAKLLEIRNKIRALDLKYFDDTEKKKTEREKEEQRKREELKRKEIELIKQLAKESVEALSAIFTGHIESEKNLVQDQINELDKKTQKEIEAVNKSTDTEQNKADKISIINARSAAQKEALEMRQRKLDQEKAKFDRAKAIGEVVAGTAVNVVKFLGNPILVALAIAVGAAQLAQILATPIPRYFKGTDNHPGGLAWVNDGGKLEVLESPSGQAYMAKGMNALVDMPAGYKVHPSVNDYYDAVNSRAFKPVPVYDSASADVARLTDVMTKQYAQQTQQLIAGMERNKSTIIVKNTWSGLMTSEKHASGLKVYLNRNVHN